MVSDYPLRVTILKYRTKTKKKPRGPLFPWKAEGGGGGGGLKNFLLQIFFLIYAPLQSFFFQSHHLENNFYPDFFFGAKTINSAIWPLISSILALCYLLFVLSLFVLFWLLLTLMKGI